MRTSSSVALSPMRWAFSASAACCHCSAQVRSSASSVLGVVMMTPLSSASRNRSPLV